MLQEKLISLHKIHNALRIRYVMICIPTHPVCKYDKNNWTSQNAPQNMFHFPKHSKGKMTMPSTSKSHNNETESECSKCKWMLRRERERVKEREWAKMSVNLWTCEKCVWNEVRLAQNSGNMSKTVKIKCAAKSAFRR